MISVMFPTIETEEDRDFMEDLFLSYRWLLYSEINKIVFHREAAEDILQTVLVKLIPHIERLRTLDRDSLVAYIIKTAKTTAYKYLDKESRTPRYSLIENWDSLDEDEGGLDPQILLFEAKEAFKTAWYALPPRSRLLLEMKHFLNYSDEKIAEEIGVSPASVCVLLSRARKRLKQQLYQ